MENLNSYDIVYFSSTTCPPCHITKPIVEKVSSENNINVKYFIVDKEENGRETAKLYEVKAVPTMVFFLNGVETGRNVGAVNESKLKDLITNHL